MIKRNSDNSNLSKYRTYSTLSNFVLYRTTKCHPENFMYKYGIGSFLYRTITKKLRGNVGNIEHFRRVERALYHTMRRENAPCFLFFFPRYWDSRNGQFANFIIWRWKTCAVCFLFIFDFLCFASQMSVKRHQTLLFCHRGKWGGELNGGWLNRWSSLGAH